MTKIRPGTARQEPECFLVYCRHADGSEPLVAAVSTPDEVRELEQIGEARGCPEVRWETVPWRRVGNSPQSALRGADVGLVITGAPDDEIGIAVFDDVSVAEAFAQEARAQGQDYRCRHVRLGEWILST